ncbi:UNVERIFIED_CONTAM: hypothetical protein K2H54_023883 [Gekko kuhli]
MQSLVLSFIFIGQSVVLKPSGRPFLGRAVLWKMCQSEKSGSLPLSASGALFGEQVNSSRGEPANRSSLPGGPTHLGPPVLLCVHLRALCEGRRSQNTESGSSSPSSLAEIPLP